MWVGQRTDRSHARSQPLLSHVLNVVVEKNRSYLVDGGSNVSLLLPVPAPSLHVQTTGSTNQ